MTLKFPPNEIISKLLNFPFSVSLGAALKLKKTLIDFFLFFFPSRFVICFSSVRSSDNLELFLEFFGFRGTTNLNQKLFLRGEIKRDEMMITTLSYQITRKKLQGFASRLITSSLPNVISEGKDKQRASKTFELT